MSKFELVPQTQTQLPLLVDDLQPPLENISYDVSPFICCPSVALNQTLHLEKDDFSLNSTITTCFCWDNTITEKRPYAQLGKVNVSRSCCCWRLETDNHVFVPSCGCDKAAVEGVAAALQERKVLRGNIQIIKLNELLSTYLDDITSDIDAMVQKHGVKNSPTTLPRKVHTKFENKTFDVTNQDDQCFGGLLATACTSTKLILQEEEMTKVDSNPCYLSSSKRPYAQLGSVAAVDFTQPCKCNCCIPVGMNGISIDAWTIIPGMGFDKQLVNEIVGELNLRMVERGNIAQLQNAERSVKVAQLLREKTALLTGNSRAIAPAAQVMQH